MNGVHPLDSDSDGDFPCNKSTKYLLLQSNKGLLTLERPVRINISEKIYRLLVDRMCEVEAKRGVGHVIFCLLGRFKIICLK